MDKSTTPFGESVKQQSVTKKIFELAKASPSDFFINISLLFTLSKIKIIHWGSNNTKTQTAKEVFYCQSQFRYRQLPQSYLLYLLSV